MSEVFLKILPKYIIDFPEVDLSDYGEIVPEEDPGEATDEDVAEDRARRHEAKAEEAEEGVDHGKRLLNFIDTVSTIQQYYGQLLNFLNIKGMMAEVVQCYIEDTPGLNMAKLANEWCKENLKLSLQKLPEVVGIIAIEEIQNDDSLSDEDKQRLTRKYRNTSKEAADVIEFVQGFMGGTGSWPKKAEEGPVLSGFVAKEYVGKPLQAGEDLSVSVDTAAGEAANAKWAHGQPLMGNAKAGEKEAKEVRENIKKIDDFVSEIDKALDIAKFCDKMTKQIPSLASVASVSDVDGRPGDIGSLKQFANIDKDFKDQFYFWEKAPTLGFSSEFNFNDLMAFVGQNIQAALEETALAAIQAIADGLMKDWLEACKKDKFQAAAADIAAQESAQNLLGDVPTGTIAAGLSSAVGSPLSDLVTLEIIYMLLNGLTKDEICSLFAGTATITLLRLLEARIKREKPALYFAGLNRLRIEAIFKTLGGEIDTDLVCADEELPASIRFCLDPTAEAAEKAWMEENGIPTDTATEVLDLRRAKRMEKLTNLLRGLMEDTLLPQDIDTPPLSVDEPYLNDIIKQHVNTIYASIFDSLAGELETFRTLNLMPRATPPIPPETAEDLASDPDPGFDQFADPEGDFFKGLRESAADEDKLVNTAVLDLILSDHYKDDVTADMLHSPEGFELEVEGSSFRLTNGQFNIEVSPYADETLFVVYPEQNKNQPIFSTRVDNTFNLTTMLLNSNFETPLTLPLDVDGAPHVVVARNIVKANFQNIYKRGADKWASSLASPTYTTDLLYSLTDDITNHLADVLRVKGRKVMNDLFRMKMADSKLFKVKNFKDLQFVFTDPCLPIFEKVKLLSMEDTRKDILKDYQTLLDADLGDFKIVNAVMLTSLVYALVQIYIYEFLLSFVYFGSQIESTFYASDAATSTLSNLLLEDLETQFLTGVVDPRPVRDDLYNIILNIPFIEADRFDSDFRYDADIDGAKKPKAKKILKELVAKTISDGNVLTQYKSIFSTVPGAAADALSQFQKVDEVDDLQGAVASAVKATSSRQDWYWYGDPQFTKTHSATIIDNYIMEHKNNVNNDSWGQLLAWRLSDALDTLNYRPIYTSNRVMLSEMFLHGSQFILEPYIVIPTGESGGTTFSLMDLAFIFPSEIITASSENRKELKLGTEVRRKADDYAEVWPAFDIFNDIKMDSIVRSWKLGLRLSLVDRDVASIVEDQDAPYAPFQSEQAEQPYPQIMKGIFSDQKLLTQKSAFEWDATPFDNIVDLAEAKWEEKTFTTFPLLKEEVAVSGREVLNQIRDLFAWQKFNNADPEDYGPDPDPTPAQFLFYLDGAIPRDPEAVVAAWGDTEQWQGRNSFQYMPWDELSPAWNTAVEEYSDSQWAKMVDRIFRSAMKKLREKMFAPDNAGFNTLLRFMFSGSELITAYRLFFMFNNNDIRFGTFGDKRSPLAKTKKDIARKMQTMLYGTPLTTITTQVQESGLQNTDAAIAKLASQTVPKMVRGILDQYDPGFMILNQLTKMGEAEKDDNVLTYPKDGFPWVAIFTTPLGVAYSALTMPEEEEPEPCPDTPTVAEIEATPVETTSDISGAGLEGPEPAESEPSGTPEPGDASAY